MIYAMSDLHGEYNKYVKMLDKIGFCDNDILYILGDVVDRGQMPVEILFDMKSRSNVFPIMGNHDKTALEVITKLMQDVDSDSDDDLDADTIMELMEWQYNGAATTIAGFQRLSDQKRYELLDYIANFSPYKVVNINEKTYILVHAGLGNFKKDKPLEDYSIYDLAFTRFNYDIRYFDDDSVYIVTGHTPTTLINGKAEIYHNCNNICIDCGAVFSDGKLACLCLDTMEEYYI